MFNRYTEETKSIENKIKKEPIEFFDTDIEENKLM